MYTHLCKNRNDLNIVSSSWGYAVDEPVWGGVIKTGNVWRVLGSGVPVARNGPVLSSGRSWQEKLLAATQKRKTIENTEKAF